MRWLVLDEVVSVEKGKRVCAKSRVPDPNTEASPEMLMVEMMAQAGGILLGAENDFQDNVVFAKIEEAKFYPGFKAGEALEIEALAENLRSEASWIQGRIQSSRGKVAEAKLMLASVGELVPGAQGSITFHPEFMKHFQIREKMTRFQNRTASS